MALPRGFERWRLRSSALEDSKQLLDRIVEAIGHALFERDDRVVGNGDALGADLGATLGDVAVTDALLLFQVCKAIFGVEWVHLERRRVHEKTRPDELLVLVVLA